MGELQDILNQEEKRLLRVWAFHTMDDECKAEHGVTCPDDIEAKLGEEFATEIREFEERHVRHEEAHGRVGDDAYTDFHSTNVLHMAEILCYNERDESEGLFSAAVYVLRGESPLVHHYFMSGPNDVVERILKKAGEIERGELMERGKIVAMGKECMQYFFETRHHGLTVVSNVMAMPENVTQEELEIMLDSRGISYAERNVEFPPRSTSESHFRHGVMLLEKGDVEKAAYKLRRAYMIEKEDKGTENEAYTQKLDEALCALDPKYDGMPVEQQVAVFDCDRELKRLRDYAAKTFSDELRPEPVPESKREAIKQRGSSQGLGDTLDDADLVFRESYEKEVADYREEVEEFYADIPERSQLHIEITDEAKQAGISFDAAKDIVKQGELDVAKL